MLEDSFRQNIFEVCLNGRIILMRKLEDQEIVEADDILFFSFWDEEDFDVARKNDVGNQVGATTNSMHNVMWCRKIAG